MIRRLISLLAFLTPLTLLLAQRPENIQLQGKIGVSLRDPQACNNAGTIRYGQHFGQSNDVGTKVIYLCAGDSMRIIHNQDFDLSGDPNAATPAGIGYAFYDCMPTIDGADLATILTDRCLNKTSPIIINGTPVPQTKGIWIAPGQRTGNITLINNGLLQTAYKGGNPVQFWFAPITVDNFAQLGYESTGGGAAGPCVDVSTDQAFSVVYLNPITINALSTNAGANGCSGSFVVKGGLPEFDGQSHYTINITKEDDPAILAKITLNADADAGDTVKFNIPVAGRYVINIEDGKSCGATQTIDMNRCAPITLSLPFVNARPGASVCLDVTVDNFADIALFQGTITWDDRVLRFNKVQNLNPKLANSQETFETPDSKTLTFLWFDPLKGVTLDSGAVLFQVCFDVVGILGQSSPVRFSDTPTPTEAGDSQSQPLGLDTQDGQINVSTAILFADIQTDSVSCNGRSDGAIIVRAAQGTAPYRVTWNNVPSTNPFMGPLAIPSSGGTVTIPNLPAGDYVVRVQDSSNPAETFTDTIKVLQALALGVNIQDEQPFCFGESTGSVRARVTVGGIILSNLTGYSFQWSTSSLNTPKLDSLASGPYAVTVTDPRGCTATASTTLSQPAPITLNATVTNASCSGAKNGGIALVATGGNSASGQYTFKWDSLGTFVVNASSVTNLTAGFYTIEVTDDNNCSSGIDTIEVKANKVLAINEVIDSITCNGIANGRVFVSGSTTGAAADLPYTFKWQGPGIPAGNSNQGNDSERDSLAAGAYTVTMTDNDPGGCQVVETYTLADPAPIAITLSNKRDETCLVGKDGGGTLSVAGGTQPYAYAWVNDARDTVSAAASVDTLRAGRYAALIRDANGCIDSLEVIINAPAPPQIQPIANDTLRCPTDVNGALTAVATPGNASITGYRWSNGATGQTITNLSPGTYYLTVTAADACAAVDSAIVVAPEPVRIDSVIATAPTCARDSDGSLTVFAAGGTQPFTYTWKSQPSNVVLKFNLYPGLAAGTYEVTVSDANNCGTATTTGTVTDPPSIVVAFTDTAPVSCFNDICNGRATASAQYSDGAQGVFTFRWGSGENDSGGSSSSAIQLCAGLQSVTVTDAKQCFSVDTIDIPTPTEILIQVDIEPVSCNGRDDGTVNLAVSGGTPGYTYQWLESGASTPDQTGLSAGTYNALVTDANGCNKSQRVEIKEPAALVLSIDTGQTENPSCNGSTDGVIAVTYNSSDSVNALGPTPYTWSDNAAPGDSPIAEGLLAGTYTVILTDIKGCQDSLSYTLTEPTPVVAVIPDPADPRCFGESTVILIDTVYGGNGVDLLDYTYQIDGNGLSFTPDQPATVFAGVHVVTVEDPKGCIYVDTLTIDQPEELTVSFEPDVVVIELGDTTQRLNPIITNSLPIETYTWTPSEGLSTGNVQRPIVSSLLNNQKFTLMVTDINGCKGEGSVFIKIDKNRNVYIPNVFSPNGDGPNDEFRVFACKGVASIKTARIFDRWGGLVYDAPDGILTNCEGGTVIWDGRRGTTDSPTGVYVYMVEVSFIDGVTLLYRGDVTLVR